MRKGDTLAGLAAGLYGDSSLWYKIAEVNGLSGQSALIEGQSLTLPAGVIRNTNNASTFQPYDPASTIGDTSPTAAGAPPKKKGCGALGQILLVIIAIAVTVASQGALAGFASSLGMSSTAATVVGGAAAAAAGSIVSQTVGVVTGIQEKFSWKEVGLAAISGGVGSTAQKATSIVQAMIQGATRSAISQGIGVVTGLQDKFSWAAVAAAGVGAGVGKFAAGSKLNGAIKASSGTASQVFVGMADAVGNAAARSLIDGSDFGDNIIAAIPSVLGGVIGSRVGSAINGAMSEAKRSRQTANAPPTGTVLDPAYPISKIENPLVTGADALSASIDLPSGRQLQVIGQGGNVREVVKQLLKSGWDALELARDHNGKVIVVANKIEQATFTLADGTRDPATPDWNLTPTGRDDSHRIGDLGGIYIPHLKTVIVATEGYTATWANGASRTDFVNAGSTNLVLHEFGHLVDHALGTRLYNQANSSDQETMRRISGPAFREGYLRASNLDQRFKTAFDLAPLTGDNYYDAGKSQANWRAGDHSKLGETFSEAFAAYGNRNYRPRSPTWNLNGNDRLGIGGGTILNGRDSLANYFNMALPRPVPILPLVTNAVPMTIAAPPPLIPTSVRPR